MLNAKLPLDRPVDCRLELEQSAFGNVAYDKDLLYGSFADVGRPQLD
jgi:hypothetical protein